MSTISEIPPVKVAAFPETLPQGPATLLLGEPGSGKTYSLRTFIQAGLEVFVLGTEPRFQDNLSDISCAQGMHWHYIPPANPGIDALKETAQKINAMSFEDLSKLKAGLAKSKYNQYQRVLEWMADFRCDRCHQSFGSIETWKANRVFVLDSLSGLNIMAMDLVVGSKPVKAIGEWGVAMENLERLVNFCTSATECFFVLVAHIESEVDENTGARQLMVSTLGRRMAPRIPRFFSDVIHCKRLLTGIVPTWTWSTVTANVPVKARYLPYSDSLEPNFKTLVDAWRARNSG
jgi:hypothetical protein